MFGYLYYLLISTVSIYCVTLYKYNWGEMVRGLFRLTGSLHLGFSFLLLLSFFMYKYMTF